MKMWLLRYEFSGPAWFYWLTHKNTHMSPHIILGPCKYFLHNIQIFSMILGSHQFFLYKTHINISYIYYPNILHVIGPSQILLIEVHKLPWVLSKILPIIAHMLSNLSSHKKHSSHYYQNWAAKLHFSHTKPNVIQLVGKTQRKPKIPKSHYDVTNSKSHYDVANSKTHYDATLCIKLVATRQYFTKSQNDFYKAQISIWHLFSQNPNSYLASIFAKPKF